MTINYCRSFVTSMKNFYNPKFGFMKYCFETTIYTIILYDKIILKFIMIMFQNMKNIFKLIQYSKYIMDLICHIIEEANLKIPDLSYS